MIPATLDITIYQGDDYMLTFRLKDGDTQAYVDLTNHTGRAQIRANKDSETIIASFVVTILDQILARGGVLLSLSPAVTSTLPLSGGVWDVEVKNASGSWVRTPLAGSVTVIQEVTR